MTLSSKLSESETFAAVNPESKSGKDTQKSDLVKSPLRRPDIEIGVRPGRKLRRRINDAHPLHFQRLMLAFFDHGLVVIQICLPLFKFVPDTILKSDDSEIAEFAIALINNRYLELIR
jgi:hypothetical protein